MINLHNKLYEKIKQTIKENKYYILTFIILLFIFNFELPYSVEMPGGFISLNNRIKITDEASETGEFGMAYVSVTKGTIPSLIISYFNTNWDMVKNEDITLENETLAESNLRSKLYQNESVANAEYVAYTSANKDITVNKTNLYVGYVNNTDSILKTNDLITKVNGVEVNSLSDILEYEQTDNNTINVDIIRNNKEMNLDVPLMVYEDHKIMGVMIVPNYDLTTNPNIIFKEQNNESGPSGGLMMALTIYDKLTGEDLTKGDKIIGTGTISMDGTVGEIGGVKYKLIGAVNKNAKIFLCPSANYDEAVELANKKNYNIDIVKVDTFKDAVEYLRSR